MTLVKLSSTLHLLESWDQKYQKSLPVFRSHLVKQYVVAEWVPLESESETMTVSVLATIYENTMILLTSALGIVL